MGDIDALEGSITEHYDGVPAIHLVRASDDVDVNQCDNGCENASSVSGMPSNLDSSFSNVNKIENSQSGNSKAGNGGAHGPVHLQSHAAQASHDRNLVSPVSMPSKVSNLASPHGALFGTCDDEDSQGGPNSEESVHSHGNLFGEANAYSESEEEAVKNNEKPGSDEFTEDPVDTSKVSRAGENNLHGKVATEVSGKRRSLFDTLTRRRVDSRRTSEDATSSNKNPSSKESSGGVGTDRSKGDKTRCSTVTSTSRGEIVHPASSQSRNRSDENQSRGPVEGDCTIEASAADDPNPALNTEGNSKKRKSGAGGASYIMKVFRGLSADSLDKIDNPEAACPMMKRASSQDLSEKENSGGNVDISSSIRRLRRSNSMEGTSSTRAQPPKDAHRRPTRLLSDAFRSHLANVDGVTPSESQISGGPITPSRTLREESEGVDKSQTVANGNDNSDVRTPRRKHSEPLQIETANLGDSNQLDGSQRRQDSISRKGEDVHAHTKLDDNDKVHNVESINLGSLGSLAQSESLAFRADKEMTHPQYASQAHHVKSNEPRSKEREGSSRDDGVGEKLNRKSGSSSSTQRAVPVLLTTNDDGSPNAHSNRDSVASDATQKSKKLRPKKLKCYGAPQLDAKASSKRKDEFPSAPPERIRTLKEVKSDLIDATATKERGRRGSVVDLGASVAATGLCLRSNLEDNNFECHRGVLRPVFSSVQKQELLGLPAEISKRRSSTVLREKRRRSSVFSIDGSSNGVGFEDPAKGSVGGKFVEMLRRSSVTSVRSEMVVYPDENEAALETDQGFHTERDCLCPGFIHGCKKRISQHFPLAYNSRLCTTFEIVLAAVSLWSVLWVPFYYAGFNDILDGDQDMLGGATPSETTAATSAQSDNRDGQAGVITSMVLVYVDVACHLVYFFVGVLLRFVTTCPDFHEGKEYIQYHDICRKILHTPGFYVDLLTLNPFLYLNNRALQTLGFLGMFRGARHLLYIPPAWQQYMMCHVHSGLGSTLEMFRVILWFFLLSHFLGCAWFSIQRSRGTEEKHIQTIEQPTLWTYYLHAFRDGAYMLMSRDRVAYTNEELALLGMIAPTGAFFVIFITGHFAVLLQRLGSMRSQRHEQLQLIRSAMDRHGLPTELQQRVLQFHLYSYMNHDQLTYAHLFSSALSTNLQVEIKLWIFRGLIRHVPFFQDASPKAIKALVLNLNIMNFSPGDVVIRCGDTSAEMYFILKGGCQVLRARDLAPIKTLREHDYFGEFALLYKQPRRRTAWVRAQVYCTLAILSAQAFNHILSEFPEQRELMRAKIKKVLATSEEKRRKSFNEKAFDNVFDKGAALAQHEHGPEGGRDMVVSTSDNSANAPHPAVPVLGIVKSGSKERPLETQQGPQGLEQQGGERKGDNTERAESSERGQSPKQAGGGLPVPAGSPHSGAHSYSMDHSFLPGTVVQNMLTSLNSQAEHIKNTTMPLVKVLKSPISLSPMNQKSPAHSDNSDPATSKKTDKQALLVSVEDTSANTPTKKDALSAPVEKNRTSEDFEITVTTEAHFATEMARAREIIAKGKFTAAPPSPISVGAERLKTGGKSLPTAADRHQLHVETGGAASVRGGFVGALLSGIIPTPRASKERARSHEKNTATNGSGKEDPEPMKKPVQLPGGWDDEVSFNILDQLTGIHPKENLSNGNGSKPETTGYGQSRTRSKESGSTGGSTKRRSRGTGELLDGALGMSLNGDPDEDHRGRTAARRLSQSHSKTRLAEPRPSPQRPSSSPQVGSSPQDARRDISVYDHRMSMKRASTRELMNFYLNGDDNDDVLDMGQGANSLLDEMNFNSIESRRSSVFSGAMHSDSSNSPDGGAVSDGGAISPEEVFAMKASRKRVLRHQSAAGQGDRDSAHSGDGSRMIQRNILKTINEFGAQMQSFQESNNRRLDQIERMLLDNATTNSHPSTLPSQRQSRHVGSQGSKGHDECKESTPPAQTPELVDALVHRLTPRNAHQ